MIVKELQPAATLASGKYVIERTLGAGGFGITYYARHTLLNVYCAIKEFFIDGKCLRHTQNHTIQIQGIDGETFARYRDKFIEEARTLAALDHPGIVKIIDVFEENNTSYIVMPYIEGRTLQKTVETNGRLDYDTAVNYIAQLNEAVDYIHKRNILHRDIKPDNVMITPDSKVILIDFGSAREFVNDATQRHTTMLTHGYAPPEQYSATSRKGSYSDIYSLGATFYFAITGEKPFDVGTRYTEDLPAPRELFADIPIEADRTVMKAIQMKTADRHQTVQEFMNDLLGEDCRDAACHVSTEPDVETAVNNVVSIVPSYFNILQRQAVIDANGCSRVLSAPSAVAMAYYHDNPKKESKGAIIILEKGSIDISIVEYGEGVLEIVSACGDANNGKNLDRIIELCGKALNDADSNRSTSFTIKDIDELILVGSNAYNPVIKDAIETYFGRYAAKITNPDRLVFEGADIMKDILRGHLHGFLLLDAISLPLGIETVGGVMFQVIGANTTFPAKKTEIFSTSEDNQRSLEIHVLQGYGGTAAENTTIGRFLLSDIPPAPKGAPQIEVTFDIDAAGMLQVSAQDKGTGKRLTVNGNH